MHLSMVEETTSYRRGLSPNGDDQEGTSRGAFNNAHLSSLIFECCLLIVQGGTLFVELFARTPRLEVPTSTVAVLYEHKQLIGGHWEGSWGTSSGERAALCSLVLIYLLELLKLPH